MVCKSAINLATQLDQIVASGRLKATDIIPVGSIVLELCSVCCLINKMLSGLQPISTPTMADLNTHAIEERCCACCSVLQLMDLDGAVLGSFSDDGDDAPVPPETQAAALSLVLVEVESVIDALDRIMGISSKASVELRRKASLESMAKHISQGLRALPFYGRKFAGRKQSPSRLPVAQSLSMLSVPVQTRLRRVSSNESFATALEKLSEAPQDRKVR